MKECSTSELKNFFEKEDMKLESFLLPLAASKVLNETATASNQSYKFSASQKLPGVTSLKTYDRQLTAVNLKLWLE